MVVDLGKHLIDTNIIEQVTREDRIDCNQDSIDKLTNSLVEDFLPKRSMEKEKDDIGGLKVSFYNRKRKKKNKKLGKKSNNKIYPKSSGKSHN